MDAFILSIGTAVPPYAYDQKDIQQKLVDVLNFDPKKIEHIYKNSAIEKRHFSYPDFLLPRKEWSFWGENFPQNVPGIKERNQLYEKEAPKLAYEAASKALKEWGGDPSSITHVISISCTGVLAPGLEFHLIPMLGLSWSVQRLGINFMGCFGAFKGIAVADAFVKENPQSKVLVVCTELCSLHFQIEPTLDNIIGNSLFADGAAAVIVGGSSKEALWRIHNKASLGLKDTLDKMTWKAGNTGFEMTLSHTIPVFLGRKLEGFVSNLYRNELSQDECDWALHPGGKGIIQAIEKYLNLKRSWTWASWEILAKYGNMSSATFLFVLQALSKSKSQKKWTSGIGFGPGLSVEGILLENL